MNTFDPLPYRPSERTRILAEARALGELSADRLDRLLVHAAATSGRFSALMRSLDGVIITEPVGGVDDLLSTGPLVKTGELISDSGDEIRQYSELVRTLPRLTRAQEHLLARRLEFARERLRRLVALVAMPDATRERLLERGLNCETLREELAASGADLDLDALLEQLPCNSCDPWVEHVVGLYDELRARFVERNLYLVLGMCAAYRTYGVPMMDLVQEGNASLIRAVEKFDWRKDVRFGTYAAFWVRQAVERLITANRGIVRVPNYIQQKMRRLRREGKLPRNPREMDVRHVSELFKTDVEGATRLMETDRSWFSLDLPLGLDEGGSYAQTLAADQPEEEITSTEKLDLGDRLEEVMDEVLSEMERSILEQRFGLGGQRTRTLDEIGAELNVSRERIRQIQVKALAKLQHHADRAPLADYL